MFKDIKIEKVTVSMGTGESGEKLEKAKKLLKRVTERTPAVTKARKREQTFGIKKGETIGAKVTLRGEYAKEFLKKALDAIEFRISKKSFDKFGNFAFGIRQYIDFPGMKYDPSLGLMGFDVCVTLTRPGLRVEKRRRKKSHIPLRHRVTKEEAMDFVSKKFQVNVYE